MPQGLARHMSLYKNLQYSLGVNCKCSDIHTCKCLNRTGSTRWVARFMSCTLNTLHTRTYTHTHTHTHTHHRTEQKELQDALLPDELCRHLAANQTAVLTSSLINPPQLFPRLPNQRNELFHQQWPCSPLLLNKLSGSLKTSSPVISVLTPTLNLNCCSVFMCFANNVWSNL